MSKAIGVALILAGLGVATAQLSFGSDLEWGSPAPVVFSSQVMETPRIATAAPAAISAVADTHVVQPRAHARTAALSAPVVVTVPHRTDPAPAPSHAPVIVPGDRVSLTQGLQRELRRVGCYAGEVNGKWTPATRAAMKAFTDRVNASLPIDSPDQILLSLVRSHSVRVCGMPCPAGQGPSEEGRCLPKAILAHAARKPSIDPASSKTNEPTEKRAPAIAGWTATATPATPPVAVSAPPAEGRMALAGPGADPQAAPDTLPSESSPSTQERNKRADRGQHTRSEERRSPQRARGNRLVESVFNSRNWTY